MNKHLEYTSVRNVKIIKKYADNKAKFNDLSSTNINSFTIKKSVKLKM